MHIPRSLLALALSLPATLCAQSAFSGRNGQAGDDNALAATNTEVRRAQPVARTAAPVPNVPSLGSGTGATLRVGDTFELRMTGMPAEDASPYAAAFTISGDGFVNIPLGGQVRASGLTQSQLEKAIERRLIDEKIFTNPTAIISIPNQGARYVTVGGNVRAPNRQVWASDLTLLVAVEAAGGAGDFGGDKIELIRNGQKTTYSIKKLKKDPMDDPKLLPGDRLDLR
jgi:polysaccharide export outer membrane protein